jgi:broad specificity phosphatase PhoE
MYFWINSISLRNYYLLFIVALLSFSVFSQENDKSTYYLIRHAEKDRSDATNKNPELTIKGQERAIKWSQVLTKFQIDAIYSTNYFRTLQTAKPTADYNSLTIKIYDPLKIDMEVFLNETKGKNVLIVGHSNTTAAFTNKLIGKDVYPEIKDNNNANLYIVTIEGEKISHVLIKME